MTNLQILQLTRSKALETTTDIISDSTILIYANLAQDDIAKRMFNTSSIKSATINFTSGVGALPADFGTLYGDPFVTSTDIYPELSIQDYTRGNYGVTIEGGQIKVYPTTTALVYIKYYPTYAAITTAGSPAIDSYFHELIVYGILYRVYEDLQDEQLSKYYRDKYESEFAIKRNALSDYTESNQRGGQFFNGISII